MNKTDNLTKIGELFGEAIADLVQSFRACAVTIESVDDENAYCTIYDGDEALPVPLSFMNGLVTLVPNVGSLSVMGFLNGDQNTPYFITHSEIDKIIFKRGKTVIDWSITPPSRDEDGEPIEDETNDKINVTIGDVVVNLDEKEAKLTAGESSIRIDTNLIEMNGGSLSGLVIVGKLTERLNKMQSEIDKVQDAVAAHKHTYIDSVGQAATPVTKNTLNNDYAKVTLTNVQNSDYENEKIKQ